MSNFQSPMGKPTSGLISPDTAELYGLIGRIEALGLILIDPPPIQPARFERHLANLLGDQ